MPVELTVPNLGESVTGGIVAAWLVAVGDRVDADQSIVELSTDKVDTEIPAPAAGVVVEILADVDEEVEVGQVLAVIDPDAVSGTAAAAAAPAAEPRQAPPAPAAAPAQLKPAAPAVVPAASSPARRGGYVQSPLVRRILVMAGIDPRTVAGTGPGGLITRADARDAVEEAESVGMPLGRARRVNARVAQRAHLATAPAVMAVDVVDICPDVWAAKRASAVVAAAAKVSRVNGTVDVTAGTWRPSPRVDLAVLVASDTGMLAPVLRAANRMGAAELAARVDDVAERAMVGSLEPDEVASAGTISLSLSDDDGMAVDLPPLLPPQVASVWFSPPTLTPVVADDGAVVATSVSRCWLVYDRQLVGRADAASFLAEVVAGLR